METNKILQGDALTKLKELPEKSINMVMTSPPYWALRDYGTDVETIWDEVNGCKHDFEIKDRKLHGGTTKSDIPIKSGQETDWKTKDGFCNKCGAWKGQLGLEPTFDLYIKHLCDIFDEVKRVLRDDGVIFVNLGDTYYTKNGSGFEGDLISKDNSGKGIKKANELRGRGLLPSKTLTMIPFRFAIEMVNRGWILRNTIIWHKRNCMPCSVKDRFTVDFEYIFFFSKKKKYWFETQLEPVKLQSIMRTKYKWDGHREPMSAYEGMDIKNMCHGEGRNKRTTWTINPKPFKEAHFAVYPEELCETPIKSGCPKEVCVKCGMPKVRDYEKGELKSSCDYLPMARKKQIGLNKTHEKDPYGALPKRELINKGYKPTCNCNTDFTGGIVLDPFFGAGTTGLVALKQGKKFIGIELSSGYIEIANKRLKPFLEQRKLFYKRKWKKKKK